jgi:hypothetical protein
VEEAEDGVFGVPFAELSAALGDAKGVSVPLLLVSVLEQAARTAHAESETPLAMLRQRTRPPTLLSAPLEHDRPRHCSSRMLR